MNKLQLQRLAEARVLEAQALMNAGHWSGAYYLAGYAVECGLKSCVLVYNENTGAIFQDKKFSEKCWTHNIEELVKLAGLDAERITHSIATPSFGIHWSIVKDWNESARYQEWTEHQSRSLYSAIADQTNGVLTWIKGHWN